MLAEEPAVRSFFDDDDTKKAFRFQSPNDNHQKDLNFPAVIRSTLTVKCPNDNSPKKLSLALHNNLLVQFINEKNIIPEFVLDILHTRLTALKPTEDESKYGFSITKNGHTYEFYCSDKRVMEDWFEALKSVCVLNTFHDDYKAIKMIGRGSFAKVYLVESKTTRKSYAVKAFTKDCMAVTNKACAKPSLLNEIEIMRALDHDNIIKLYEIYETDKSIYLVLELIQGKSLYDLLNKPNFKKDISLPQIHNIARSLLDALAYLASKGIMHRDLKPDNILLDKGEKVKLVDFGLATFIDVPAYIFKKCGTPGYIAPEVFKYNDKCPNTNYDDRCDVFSVGCLLHHMLFGAPFFEGPTAGEILKLNRNFLPDYPGFEKIKLELNNPNGNINKEGLALLLDLLEYDMKKRMYANQALIHPFFGSLPNSLQRLDGSGEFSTGSLSKYGQLSSELKSPSSPLHPNSLTHTQSYSPLKPLRIDSSNKENAGVANKDRFVKEDSLYLDLGRPEINGRTDTIASGSTNNSILLNRPESASNVSPTFIPSAFGGKNSRNSSNKKNYGGKGLNQGANQSFLKAAIFNSMQRNNSENVKDDEVVKNLVEGLKITKTTSDFARYGDDDEEDDTDEISHENAGIHHHIEKINLKNPGMHPSKISHSKMGRFQPTSPNCQVAQKHGNFSDV